MTESTKVRLGAFGMTLQIASVAFMAFGEKPVVVLPQTSQVSLSGQTYAITLASGDGPYTAKGPAAATSLCPAGDNPGEIQIGSKLTLRQQAKALVHETVHVAVRCDERNIAAGEKVAEAIADLLESSDGQFVIEGLKR
jgi:hypothetical protein